MFSGSHQYIFYFFETRCGKPQVELRWPKITQGSTVGRTTLTDDILIQLVIDVETPVVFVPSKMMPPGPNTN